MEGILKALEGRKTYVIVALGILCVLAEKFAGIDIPGFDPGSDWLGYIMGLLGLGTLRAGVTKSGPA
jgi:hypothetical protein